MNRDILKRAEENPAANYPEYGQTFPLRCGACGAEDEYHVRRIVVHPSVMEQSLAEVRWEDAVSFSGYFLCRSCQAGGPWEFTTEGKVQILQLLFEHDAGKECPGLVVGIGVLFDGTLTRNAFEAEQHYRKLLSVDPNNAHLWNRLGNMFVAAAEDERALPAFLKAIELEPRDAESLHSLGNYWMERRDFVQAASYYHRVLRCGRNGIWHVAATKRALIQHALEMLLRINQRTNGAVEVLPKPDPEVLSASSSAGMKTGTAVAELRTFDLSSEDDWDRLVSLFADAPKPRPNVSQVVGPRRVRVEHVGGRNAPCPCGSGKKTKYCCRGQ